MTTWQRLVTLAVAGAVGTLARYAATLGLGAPTGTLTVNVLGCLIAGWISALTLSGRGWNPDLALAVLVGFLGAFTTFSSLLLDVVTVAATHRGRALGTLALHLGLGAAAVVLGGALARIGR